MLPNKNIQQLSPYISIPHKIWNLSNKKNILKLDWNEASIPPSPYVIKAINNFLSNGHLNWYPNTKNLVLLDELANYCNQKDSSYIEIFPSSDAAHECILDVFLEKNDKVCIVAPTYDNFRARANGVGIQTVIYPLDENFDLDFNKLEYFIKDKNIKLLYLCNPNNPTGKAYNIEKIKDLIINNDNTIFLIDEAYYEFCNKSVEDIVWQCKNLIITRTFSKAFALASFRIGYVISHYENIKALNKLRNPKNISMLSQVAAFAALKDLAYTKSYVNEVTLAREEFLSFLKHFSIANSGGGGYEMDYYPSMANFILIKIKNVSLFCNFLQERDIFIRSYSHIIKDHCRISIGTREQMKIVAKNMQEFNKVNNH